MRRYFLVIFLKIEYSLTIKQFLITIIVFVGITNPAANVEGESCLSVFGTQNSDVFDKNKSLKFIQALKL